MDGLFLMIVVFVKEYRGYLYVVKVLKPLVVASEHRRAPMTDLVQKTRRLWSSLSSTCG